MLIAAAAGLLRIGRSACWVWEPRSLLGLALYPLVTAAWFTTSTAKQCHPYHSRRVSTLSALAEAMPYLKNVLHSISSQQPRQYPWVL